MKKILKRILLAVAALLLTAIILAAVAYRLASRPPGFYHPYEWDDTRRSIINQQAADKLLLARQNAQRSYYGSIRAQRNGTRPATAPSPLELEFTEEELNALLIHSGETYRAIKDRYEEYFTSPGIYLKDGRIIAAAQVKDLGYVVSLHFSPALDPNGMLRVTLDRVAAGQLALPEALVRGQLDRVRSAVRWRIGTWKQEATVDQHGGANASAVKLAGGRLLLSALDGRPSDAVLFVPVDEKGTSMAMRITRLNVNNGLLRVSVEPMTPDQTRRLVEQK